LKRLTFALATLLVLATLTVVCAQAQTPAPTPAPAAAAPTPAPSKIDRGDTAWMLTSTALVLMMTAPGLALFYGGMVRQKNALATLMQSFIIMAVISIQWVLWGYSLAFGPDKGGIIGGLEWIGLRGVGVEPFDTYSKTIPHQVFTLAENVLSEADLSGMCNWDVQHIFEESGNEALWMERLLHPPKSHPPSR